MQVSLVGIQPARTTVNDNLLSFRYQHAIPSEPLSQAHQDACAIKLDRFFLFVGVQHALKPYRTCPARWSTALLLVLADVLASANRSREIKESEKKKATRKEVYCFFTSSLWYFHPRSLARKKGKKQEHHTHTRVGRFALIKTFFFPFPDLRQAKYGKRAI